MRAATRRWREAAGLGGLAWAMAWPAPAAEPPILTPVRAYEVAGTFATDDGPPPAHDLSGIACEPGVPRRCLVINDQETFAQRATVEDGRITAGDKLPLIGAGPSPDTVGVPPAGLGCSEGAARFKDLDGEAVAYAAPHYYVAGSHGCGRYSRKARLSGFLLARLPADGSGPVETSHRLSEVLATADLVGAYFSRDLMGRPDGQAGDAEPNGLNVEGVAVVDGTLWAGLRAPSLLGRGFLVGADVEALFRGESGPLRPKALVPLALGEGAGIRDLAPLPDGRLLILSGPAQEQADLPYRLFAAEPRPAGALTPLGTLAGVVEGGRSGKAEAVLPLGVEDGHLRVLVLFDGLANGAPREYRVPWPGAVAAQGSTP